VNSQICTQLVEAIRAIVPELSPSEESRMMESQDVEQFFQTADVQVKDLVEIAELLLRLERYGECDESG
jgi:hypothetical protein